MHSFRPARVFFSILLGLGLAAWMLPSAAQDKPASDTKKDDQPKKPKPPVREEQEESKTPTIKKPIKVDDDDVDVRRPKPAKLGISRPADLEPEAQNAKHQAIKELFHNLARERDVVNMKNGKTVLVDPIPEFIGPHPDPEQKVHLQAYDDAGKPAVPQDMPLKNIVKIRHYEENALTDVDNLLDRKAIPRLDLLQAAEKALTAVVRFHSSARERQLRKGDAWNELEKRLRDKLIAVQLEQLQTLADVGDWENTYALAARLGDSYSDKQQLRSKFAFQVARVIGASLKAEKFEEVRVRTKMLEELFPDSPAAVPVSDDLRQKAADLFEQAKQIKDPTEALKLAAKAETIWPDLPGIRDFRLKLGNTYPILLVGVPSLPQNMSPATAVTESEKQAVELIFESLVKPEEDATAGQLYVPGLALDRPRVIPLGRQFQLVHDAHWSTGEKEPVNATDVTRTVQLLRNPEAKSFAPEWADLIDNPPPSSDPYTVNLTLRQGYLDPLSLMLFKVLPAGSHLDSPDDPHFARKPIGSGPFQLQGKDGNAVVFTANPYYRRSSKPGLPHIREIRMTHSDNPGRDFAEGRLHLLVDLPTDKITAMKSVKGVTVQTMPNRRIYFLAVNHRARMLQNEDLRRTIAHAIDRTKILNEIFRGDQKSDPMPPHRPLNGPYPPGAWACKPTLPADPYEPELAKVRATKVKSVASVLKISLKYPDNDPQVKRACEAIRDQVAALGTGLRIELEPKPPRLLHDEVEIGHDFELAYYYFDYPTDAYWLWPLFNTNPKALGRGGKNYMGYQNDGQLESLFIKAMGHRDFQEVQNLTHEIHAHLYQKMPLIPLWQLDTHLAIHNDLKPVRIDPLLVFTNVEHWKLEKKQ
ncbi:MAG TPA: ABC transporter substrate-binding protein [Gemmataceae bacterium]|nr:ABC transporter substrate-binding protein [Gemmataceae bacterium]